MIYLFKRTVYNCHQATLLSVKRDEGVVTVFERLKLAYHLLYCDPCRRFIAQSGQLDRTGKKLTRLLSSKPPFVLSDAARDRMQKIVEEL